MGGTTAIVLVALIIAVMVAVVIALVVWGGVRALEVRHESRRSPGMIPAITHSTPTTTGTRNGTSLNGVAHHEMFDRGPN